MFDLIIALVLLVSAGVGFMRGATRELVAVIAFVLAVILAVLSLRISAPIAQAVVETAWLARALAMLIVFVIAYILLRLLGWTLTRRIHETPLGAIDRVIGLGFGLIRALIILGLFNIVFHAATPVDRTPSWVIDARLYPVTSLSVDALRALAPQGSSVAGTVGPALKKAVTDSGDAPPPEGGDKAKEDGYDAGTLKKLDDLVEKSL